MWVDKILYCQEGFAPQVIKIEKQNIQSSEFECKQWKIYNFHSWINKEINRRFQ